MDGFYVSIIFIGILLIIFSLVWAAFDKKKNLDQIKKLSEKKDELVEIINDADQMIDELNRYSDYIVTQITNKQEEVARLLKDVDQKLVDLKAVSEVAASMDTQAENSVNTVDFNNSVNNDAAAGLQTEVLAELLAAEPKGKKGRGRSQKTKTRQSKNQQKQNESMEIKEKVLPLNQKYTNVLKLAEQGLDATEIAKRLGMGKGEIQLILGTSGAAELMPEAGTNT